MRDRPLAAALFAGAGLPGWVAVAASVGGLSPLQAAGYALAGSVASGAAGALAGRVLAAEARAGASLWKGAALGVLVSALGVGLAAVALALSAGVSRAVLGAVAGVFGALLVPWLPWLVPGAVAGVAVYRLRREPPCP